MGRAEWLRNFGYSYSQMEKDGIMLPVMNMNIDYLKPAKYDDLLTLKTILIKKPSVKIEFNFEIYNEQNELLTTAYTKLVFLDAKKNRPTKCPEHLLEKINPLFL
jgi:acyl-CoA thioester hydrolase